MTDALPFPLTPANADLTDFQFMPLQIARLRKSKAWLICKRRPELAFYMLNLWTAAWHENPAGSLEDDDDVLADMAMCSPERWDKVKEAVLRGWIKCSDKRLYHPVVAEKVMEAWKQKRVHAYDRECGRLRKAATRSGIKDFTPPTFEEWSRISQGQSHLSNGHPNVSAGHIKDKPGTSHISPPENALKGEGEGQGQGQGYKYTLDKDVRRTDIGSGERPRAAELTAAELHAHFERVMAKYPTFAGAPNLILVEKTCRQLIDDGDETWDSLEDHAERFANFVKHGGRSGPQYVDNPLKFFSTQSLRRAPWDPPPTKAQVQQDANIDASLQWLREQEAKDATG